MPIQLGLSGARRNAAAALCERGRVVAVCEQERITRTRAEGLRPGHLPREAIDCVLAVAGRRAADIDAYAPAEQDIRLPGGIVARPVAHHFAHAATAFYTSPFAHAVVIVCDGHSSPGLSVWRGDAEGLTRLEVPWQGPGFATLYAAAARAFGMQPDSEEHRVEAMARLGAPGATGVVEPMVSLGDDRLIFASDLTAAMHDWLGGNGRDVPMQRRADLAGALQGHAGRLLLDFLSRVRTVTGADNLCLAGGLFYNSYLTTQVAMAGIYDQVFVPANPGNAGASVGAGLAGERVIRQEAPVSPFLGPEYGPDEIKAVLDNCKLSYGYLRDDQLIDEVVGALVRGKLVGWFQGRMEWGSRALGNRSILASPFAPYTLDNLNVFLKQRESYRSYSLSVCAEDAAAHFSDGPSASPFMQYEYRVRDASLFRPLWPGKPTPLRVQTVHQEPVMFRRLLKAFGSKASAPVLVNTSFNGFREPIVCSPRDAVRVFYGTGLDLAVIGSFVLRK